MIDWGNHGRSDDGVSARIRPQAEWCGRAGLVLGGTVNPDGWWRTPWCGKLVAYLLK